MIRPRQLLPVAIRPSFAVLAVLASTTFVVAPSAEAHQLAVLDGAGEIDAGTAATARLVHALLVKPDDTLTVTAQPRARAMQAVLYVPDLAPERGFRDREWPSVQARYESDRSAIASSAPTGEIVVDDATGIAYREVVRMPLEDLGRQVTVVVHRGSVPTRVALRIGQPTEFLTTNADAAPHAVQDVLAWADTPPPGSHAAKEKTRKADRSRARFAWGGIGITLVALLIAAWWIGRGWHTARRRGAGR